MIDQNGELQEDVGVMCNIVHNYFENLFSKEVGEVEQNILADVHRRVSPEIGVDKFNRNRRTEPKEPELKSK